MDFTVKPSSLCGGIVEVPGDKSISHRALMFSGIANGRATISGFLAGEDCLCTMRALQTMGVNIDRTGETTVTVNGVGLKGLSEPTKDLDMGNSGTAMRLFAGMLAGQSFDSTLTGDESLSRRPMSRVIEPLESMGAAIEAIDGKPPLRVTGGQCLLGVDYQMPVASAQVKSALLLGGLYAKGETAVTEPAVTRDHTERMFEAMGVRLSRDAGRISLLGGQQPTAIDIAIPADLSSAAFPLVAAILSDDCELTVKNVGINPTRTGVLGILKSMGANIKYSGERMMGAEPVADITARSSQLSGIVVDPQLVSLAIDEFPLLFVAAALAIGETRFSGIDELRVKESDRIGAMVSGLASLGVRVDESADGALVHGGKLSGGTVQSYGDHRIAMAFAVAAGFAADEVRVLETDAVNTSFPGFVECMRAVGLEIGELPESLDE